MTAPLKTKKDQVFEEAKDKFQVKLDRRLTLDQLNEQLKQLQRTGGKPVEAERMPVPKLVKNVITGNVFEYNPIFKNNPDLQIIEWETPNGND